MYRYGIHICIYTVETPLKNMEDITHLIDIHYSFTTRLSFTCAILLPMSSVQLHTEYFHPRSMTPLPFLFFYNFKHHINHELSFRVVSEKRYACRRNAPARVFTVRPSAPETAAASILLPPYVLSFEKIGSIFIITKYIFPSRDDVLFSRDTVRFESGSPRGYDSGVKRRRKRKTRKHVHNATAFADVH